MTNNPSWSARVLTLFPEMFPGPLGHSLSGKALENGIWRLDAINIRDYATDRHHTVDDTPYGGGAGMVMKPDVIAAAIDATERLHGPSARRIFLSPRGKLFDQEMAQKLANCGSVLLLCGRYEGMDQRVIEARNLEEVSVGDFVLAGGEMAAMVILEACVRLLPGVMGNSNTVNEESFAAGLLEYPHYTRPPSWEGREVPDVLLSGDHGKVNKWRRQQSESITRLRRPDLLDKITKK